jgi:hypothetical protein
MVVESGQIPLLRERVRKAMDERYPPATPEIIKQCKERKHRGNPWLESWEDGFFVPLYNLAYPSPPAWPKYLPEDPKLWTSNKIYTDLFHLYTQSVLSWCKKCDAIDLDFGLWLQLRQEVRRRWITDARRGCPKWRRGYCGALCRDGSECRSLVTPHGSRCQRHGGAKQEEAFLKRLESYESMYREGTDTYLLHAPMTARLMRFLDDDKPSGLRSSCFKRAARGRDSYAMRRARVFLSLAIKSRAVERGPAQIDGLHGEWVRKRYDYFVSIGCPFMAEYLYGRRGIGVSG